MERRLVRAFPDGGATVNDGVLVLALSGRDRAHQGQRLGLTRIAVQCPAAQRFRRNEAAFLQVPARPPQIGRNGSGRRRKRGGGRAGGGSSDGYGRGGAPGGTGAVLVFHDVALS
jgi:hypothetical protein